MKPGLHRVLTLATCLLAGALSPRPAVAADGGLSCAVDADCAGSPDTPFCASDTGTCVACVDYEGISCIPLRCDGGLCDTTNGGACGTAGGRSGAGGSGSLGVLVALALVVVRTRRRRAAGRRR